MIESTGLVLRGRCVTLGSGNPLLDEATSALDNRTQAVVTDTLGSLNITRVVVAHRLSTIRRVDRIIVLKDGRVAESGSCDELMSKKGVFCELTSRQLV